MQAGLEQFGFRVDARDDLLGIAAHEPARRQHALRRHELFKRVVQSLSELSTNSERSLLESISNHIGAKGARRDDAQPSLPGMADAETTEES